MGLLKKKRNFELFRFIKCNLNLMLNELHGIRFIFSRQITINILFYFDYRYIGGSNNYLRFLIILHYFKNNDS